LCEFSSVRTGIPFGWYYYTGSTEGQELYIADVPFMDSLSFPFPLYASYCIALAFILPALNVGKPDFGVQMIKMDFPLATRMGWPVMLLTILFLHSSTSSLIRSRSRENGGSWAAYITTRNRHQFWRSHSK
jgi:putative membrane protein